MAEERKHPRVLEAIEMAKKATTITRGMYPFTKASHVFKEDGTPLETETNTEVENEEPAVEEPKDPETP